MDRVRYEAKKLGGFIRIHRIEDGKAVDTSISVNGERFGQQIARELNRALSTGVRLAQDAVLSDPAPKESTLERAHREAASSMIAKVLD